MATKGGKGGSKPEKAAMAAKAAERQIRAIDKVRKGVSRRRRKFGPIKKWNNLELWFGPLTTDDMEAVDLRLINEGCEDPLDEKHRHRRNILLLIHKAQDKDGKRAFEFGDEHYLRTEADYLIMQMLIGFMFESAIDLESVHW